MILITSSSNSLYKKFLSLTESKGLKTEGLFLLSGSQIVQEFLRHPNLEIESEIFCQGQTPALDLKKQIQFSTELFQTLDVMGTKFPLLAVRQPTIPLWNPQSLVSGLTLLTPLGDPANLGALIRSAEAFGVAKVVLLKESAHAFLPKSVKASAGSVTRVRLEKGPSIRELEAFGGSYIGLEMRGRSLAGFTWPEESRLIIGEEGAGLPDFSKLQRISIPTQKVESLNATVAASIALYDYSQKNDYSQKKLLSQKSEAAD